MSLLHHFQVQRKKKLTRHLTMCYMSDLLEMSELLRLVYMKSDLTLHMKASAQKVNFKQG